MFDHEEDDINEFIMTSQECSSVGRNIENLQQENDLARPRTGLLNLIALLKVRGAIEADVERIHIALARLRQYNLRNYQRSGRKIVINDPDGRRVIQFANGTTICTYPTGLKCTVSPDGTHVDEGPGPGRTIQKPNGTRFIRHADGTKSTETPDGARFLLSPDGTYFREFSSGRGYGVTADGTVLLKSPCGVVAAIGPSGHEFLVMPSGVLVVYDAVPRD